MISIMIDSASRPDLLQQTLDTVREHLKFEGELYWMHHEAVLDKELSDQCIEIAERAGMFDLIEVENNPQGEGISITKMLNKAKGNYFVHWEDDFLACREIDLDLVYDLFEWAVDVQQIIFNRRQTMSTVSGFVKKEVARDGHTLTTSPHWRYTPAMWRLAWILPRWHPFSGNNSHWAINHRLQRVRPENKLEKTAEWVIENTGTYYLGPIGEPEYCRHNGYGRSGRKPGTV